MRKPTSVLKDATATIYEYLFNGGGVEFYSICNSGGSRAIPSVSEYSEITIWVGDTRPGTWGCEITGSGDVRALRECFSIIKEVTETASGVLVAEPTDVRRKKAYRYLERLGFVWDNGAYIFRGQAK